MEDGCKTFYFNETTQGCHLGILSFAVQTKRVGGTINSQNFLTTTFYSKQGKYKSQVAGSEVFFNWLTLVQDRKGKL